MVAINLLAALSCVATLTASHPAYPTPSQPAARNCKDLRIPISISARNGVLNLTAPSSRVDVVNFILDETQAGKNYTASILQGYRTVSGNYTIAATYCEPSTPPTALQVLTHGIGFDRAYWDFPYGNYNYSYVNRALERGYATFAYDRLGIAQSSHGDPVNEIQASLEVAALRYLTEQLRAATVPGLESKKFSKIVHVGHSFGSQQTYALTALDASISDGIALTGFSLNGTYASLFAIGGNFGNANMRKNGKGYLDGYLSPGDASALQVQFFAPGMFDQGVLRSAFQTGQPVTVGELLTSGGVSPRSNGFGGPVLVITGERDLVFCGGNCLSSTPSIPAMSKAAFPNARNFSSFVVPNAGHGLNLQYSWPLTYSTILDFFDQNSKA